MAKKIIMPKQGLQMTEGTITKWLKKEGDVVLLDEPLFEMETDKLTIEITSTEAGTLLKIVKGEGEVVPITHTIAFVGESGEVIKEVAEEKVVIEEKVAFTHVITPEIKVSVASADGKIYSTPRARMVAFDKGINISGVPGTGPEGLIIERDVLTYKGIKATPLAKKLAEQNNVDLSKILGTGPNGKILKSDVLNFRGEKLIPFTGMRKAISENMMKSIHSMAQANHRMKVDMSEVIKMRDKLKADGIKVSFTDILVKAVARVLTDFPIINSSYSEQGIILKEYINIGVAVALDEGLIVPVIKDADILSLQEISENMIALRDKALSGSLTPDEYKGGTFTVTNLGMFDIDEFTAIINPPESAILAVGKIDRVPVAQGDSIVIKPIMMLSLTYDHRVIDGAPAAKFLQSLKQLLQNPNEVSI